MSEKPPKLSPKQKLLAESIATEPGLPKGEHLRRTGYARSTSEDHPGRSYDNPDVQQEAVRIRDERASQFVRGRRYALGTLEHFMASRDPRVAVVAAKAMLDEAHRAGLSGDAEEMVPLGAMFRKRIDLVRALQLAARRALQSPEYFRRRWLPFLEELDLYYQAQYRKLYAKSYRRRTDPPHGEGREASQEGSDQEGGGHSDSQVQGGTEAGGSESREGQVG